MFCYSIINSALEQNRVPTTLFFTFARCFVWKNDLVEGTHMTKDLTSGNPFKIILLFTLPLMLGNLFQLTYNAVDSIIVGKFVGEDALAAVGTSNPLMTLAILFINGVCLGAGILVSLAFGAGNTELVET